MGDSEINEKEDVLDGMLTDPADISTRPEGHLRSLLWEEGTYQDLSGHRHRCWISPEKLHGLKIYILDTRTLEKPILISEHSFDINKISEEERDDKAFLLLNGTSTRPKVEMHMSFHPTRGEAQLRAERVYTRSVMDLFVTQQTDQKHPHKGVGNLATSLKKFFG